jgi:hypothetical protein
MAERELMIAIQRAEAFYEATAELGAEFDRRLDRSESFLRDAGYLRRDGHGRDVAPMEPRADVRPTKSQARAPRRGPGRRLPAARGLAL